MIDLALFNDAVISRLAREVARNLFPVQQIRESFRLTIEEFDHIVETPMFKQRLEEEIAVWSSSEPANIIKRIGAKAATLIEESFAEVFYLIHDRSQPMAAKIEALKWAARMAGADANPNVKDDGRDSQVKITINIGDKRIDLEKDLPPRTIEGDVVDLTQNTV
jgi:hypothetical protein